MVVGCGLQPNAQKRIAMSDFMGMYSFMCFVSSEHIGRFVEHGLESLAERKAIDSGPVPGALTPNYPESGISTVFCAVSSNSG
jgi:hypothetical protein